MRPLPARRVRARVRRPVGEPMLRGVAPRRGSGIAWTAKRAAKPFACGGAPRSMRLRIALDSHDCRPQTRIVSRCASASAAHGRGAVELPRPSALRNARQPVGDAGIRARQQLTETRSAPPRSPRHAPPPAGSGYAETAMRPGPTSWKGWVSRHGLEAARTVLNRQLAISPRWLR